MISSAVVGSVSEHRSRKCGAQHQNDDCFHLSSYSYSGFGKPSITAIERSMTSGGSG